jgi:hypothetical protein
MAAAGAALFGLETGVAQAITITPTNNVTALVNALIAGNSGIVITNATLQGQSLSTGQVSTGTFTNLSGTYPENGFGIGQESGGIVISTGNVADYADGPNTSSSKSTSYNVSATPAQEALLDPLSGASFPHYDVTQLDITFDMLPGKDTIYFDVVFGSEEFPEFIGSSFIDAFGLFVNDTNIAFANGQPININNTGYQAVAGTELDGIVTHCPVNCNVLNFSQFVGNGSTGNTLTFIIGDASDTIYDTTAYIANFGGTNIPEPSSVLGLFALGALGAGSIIKRKLK